MDGFVAEASAASFASSLCAALLQCVLADGQVACLALAHVLKGRLGGSGAFGAPCDHLGRHDT